MSACLVSLPMYEAPGRAADALRDALVARLEARGLAPRFVEPDDLFAHWRSPDLLLSQTCGYPLAALLGSAVRLVATPVYEAPGCEGPFYRSAVIVRRDHPASHLAALRGSVAAFNAAHSQSGTNGFRALVAPLARGGRFFERTVETGGHRRSVEAVIEGRADVAAIDSVTLALLIDEHPDLPLRTLAFTPPAPALPFVTSGASDGARAQTLFETLEEALEETRRAGLDAALRLRGFHRLPLQAYDVILEQEREARRLGYPDLA